MASLVKKLDAATAKHAQAEMCSFVVFCGDADRKELEKKVKEFAAKEKIAHTELAIDAAAGPEEYKIAKEADVTVLLYVNKTVKANFAFKKGDLTDKEIDKVLAALPKILEP